MDTSMKKGIINMLIASIFFALVGAFAKLLSPNLDSVEIVFFRNILGVIIIVYSIYKRPLSQEGGRFILLTLRGLIGFIALLMYFYNITKIPLAEAMTFSKASPLFSAIFAFFWLKEKLSVKAWFGIMLGFFGVLMITGFNLDNLNKNDWLGIFCALGAGLAYTTIKKLSAYYEGRAIVLSFMIIGTLGPLILMVLANFYHSKEFDFILSPFIMPKGIEWIYILFLGIFATCAQIFMTKAYFSTKVGIIGTISYSNIIISIFLGTLLGDAIPNIYILAGIALIIFSGYLVSRK